MELFSKEKIFIQKIFVVLKLSAFCFEISSFSSPGCCISLILHLLQLVCGMAQFYFTGGHLEYLERRHLNFSKIGTNLYQEFVFIG